jgi:hypothetical protein
MADKPFAVGYVKRAHILPAAPQFHQEGHPVVAMCGTVFVPTNWDPSDEPDCRPCHEAQLSLIGHHILVLMDEESALRRRLAGL